MSPDDILYIVRTTCLLESRSAQYEDYLQRALPGRFATRVKAWAADEARHGELLRDWLSKADPEFDIQGAQDQLSTLPYHAVPTQDRPPAEELLARCVVEALASGFYRALREATADPSLRRICQGLMADEARHFAQFQAMAEELPALSGPRRLVVVIRRIRQLDDDQILFASHCANHAGPYHRARARRRYLTRVYGMYRPEHLGYVQAMLFRTLGRRPAPWLRTGIARSLFAVVQLRRASLLVGFAHPGRLRALVS